MADEQDDEFDEVTGLEPRAHGRRFGEGQPRGRGRPKGSPNLSTMVKRVLMKRYPIKLEGKQRSLPAIEIILLNIRNKAATGDRRALKLWGDLLAKFPAFQPEAKPRVIAIFPERWTIEEWEALYDPANYSREGFIERFGWDGDKIRREWLRSSQTQASN